MPALVAWRNAMFAALSALPRWLLATLSLCVWIGAAQVAGAQTQVTGKTASSAAVMVDALHQVLQQNLRDGDAQGFKGRLQRLQPVVAKSFDFPAIARVALGRKAFEALDSAGQRRFIELLTSLSVATYADRFSGTDSLVRLVILSERPARGGRVLVKTHLQRPADEPVTLDYVVQNASQGSRIINVLANGVSDLSLKRAQYAAVIRANGVEALFQRIEEQLRELTGQHSGG